ncbi:MFS transporter [Desulfogranum japonicum]|uniref:MFS transporter n=1 Tax=Desulfogranum japonicum TaxID=231447 RepID=UPI0003F93E13|nr:MFS transporter [Desulfogranum japonicum]
MHRKIFVTVLFAVFIALLGVGIVIPVLPLFATQLGASGFGLGLIVAAFSVSRGLLQPLVGALSDRHGRKEFLIAGLIIYAIVGLLIPLAPDVSSLVVIRLLHGVGSAMIVPIGMAYMSYLAPTGHEGRYMSYLNISIFCGIGCGPILGGVFFDTWGYTSVFYSMASLSFCAFLLVLWYMPANVPTDKVQRPGIFENIGAMLTRKRTRGILLARYATMTMMVPTMAFLPILMSRWETSTGLHVGLVIACRTLVNAVLQIPFGKLTDRYNKTILLFIGSLSMALLLVCIPHGTQLSHMFALYMLLGCGEAIIWPVLGAYATEEGRKHYGHGTMMGVFNLAMSAGVFTGAMIAGITSDAVGMQWSFYAIATGVMSMTWLGIYYIVKGETSQASEGR